MGYKLRNHGKWAHRVATEVSRVVNGNLDGSIDHRQVEAIILHALRRHVSSEQIIAGFNEAAVGAIDGQSIEKLVKQARQDN